MARGSTRVIYAALSGNLLIALTKFVAAALTGSAAMLSEGIHSLVDTGNQILLLHGMRRADRPPDERFPFGHGKEVYFWSFVVAILIFAVGAGISIVEGIRHVLAPTPIKNPAVNYVVLSLAMIFEGAAWTFAFVEFRRAKGPWGYLEAVHRGKDPSLFVVLFEDSAALLGLLVALAAVTAARLTGVLWLDGLGSILIGIILGGTATWLAYETKGLLIGESANRRVVDGIRAIASERTSVEQVHEVLTMHMGPEFVLVNLSVQFRGDARATEIEAAIEGLDRTIKIAYPEVKRVFVEAERYTDRAAPAAGI